MRDKRKKIELKDKETGEILNLDTPICFVANGCSWEFNSIKELMDVCEDIEEDEEPKSGIEGIRLNDMISGRHIVEIDFTKVEEAEKAVKKFKAWHKLMDYWETEILGWEIRDMPTGGNWQTVNVEFNVKTRKEPMELLDILFGGEK